MTVKRKGRGLPSSARSMARPRRRHGAVRGRPRRGRAAVAADPMADAHIVVRAERLGTMAVQLAAYGLIVALLVSNRWALIALLRQLWGGG